MEKQEFEKLIDDLHSSENPESKFECIASCLMNKLCINAGGNQYRIVECEIYYSDGKHHKDQYLYGNEILGATKHQIYSATQQKKKLHWFFHYSGIDLTIGNGSQIKGGILIRTVQDANNEFIGGPSKLCINLLNDIHCDVFSFGKGHLCLEEYPFNNENIISSERIGLNRKKIIDEIKQNKFLNYKCKYRYSTETYTRTEKYKNDTTKNIIRINEIELL